MKTMRVTGKGQLKVKPDRTRLTLTLEGTSPEYGETLRRSSENTERLRDILTEHGFERSDLKTLNFSVDPEYESYKEKGAYRQRLTGYRFHHFMKVEFDSDNERLGKVLFALAHSTVQLEIRISYTVKDPEAAKNALLGKAVSDAMDKARVLAASTGITLRAIQNIDYSWGEIDLEVHPMNRAILGEACMAPMENESYDMDIEPDDIEVSDTVTVLWEIE